MWCIVYCLFVLLAAGVSSEEGERCRHWVSVCYESPEEGHTERSLIPLPYLTLPQGWAGFYTCPGLRPYQFGPMRVPECNHKVTDNGYKAVDGCEAVNRRL